MLGLQNFIPPTFQTAIISWSISVICKLRFLLMNLPCQSYSHVISARFGVNCSCCIEIIVVCFFFFFSAGIALSFKLRGLHFKNFHALHIGFMTCSSLTLQKTLFSHEGLTQRSARVYREQITAEFTRLSGSLVYGNKEIVEVQNTDNWLKSSTKVGEPGCTKQKPPMSNYKRWVPSVTCINDNQRSDCEHLRSLFTRSMDQCLLYFDRTDLELFSGTFISHGMKS